ncbi:hypothetical protein ACSFA8_13940 [Variovorax sp. RT4R15]|uniref:hypothetical protein n=1 Tax=Variovorax sp. RT4R15 TaxID=3443737 RepID=UPI003F449C74
MTRWRLVIMLLGGAAYAGLSHWMMLFHATEPWAVAVLLVPLWLTALGLAGARFGRWALLIVAAAGAGLLWLVMRGEAGDPNRLYVLQHVGINALLCGWFGSTLRGDGLSLIGQFAERVHAIGPGQRRYTHQVTVAWTLYFAVVVVASIVVYLTLPFAAWSLLSNVVTPIGVTALFVGEHFMRYRLHPEFERVRMIDAVRAFSGAPIDRSARR